MSKKNPKYDYLPKLQKEIVLTLAKHGAMTMSETNRKIGGKIGEHRGKWNSATNLAFDKLESQKMVNKVGVWEYRGRKFDTYWLSNKGLAFAMLNGAKAETAKKHYETLSQTAEDKKGLELYFGLHSLSPRIANALDEFILLAGKVNPQELLLRLIPVLVSSDEADMKKVFDMTAEFPNEWKGTLESMKKLTDMSKRMMLKEPEKPKGE